MTVVRPFRAVRYDTKRVELSKVIVPPYDVIASDEREGFFDFDPHNAIRFELTRDAADEADANYLWIRELLDAWRASGILIRDDSAAFYVMGQQFTAPSGEILERVGFIAELELEEYETRVVRPHERTLSGPKADRLKLLRSSEANLSCVFLLYEDRADELAEMLVNALDEGEIGRARDQAGIAYRLGRLTQPDEIERIQGFLAARPSVIADGHHRYETALEYKRQQIEANGDQPFAPWRSTIAFFANAYASGSLLLPIHRVVRDVPAPDLAQWRERLSGWTITELAKVSPDDIEMQLAEELALLAPHPAFVAASADGPRLLIRRNEARDELMVRIIEDEVLSVVFGLDPEAIRTGAVSFPKSAKRAAKEIEDGVGTVALYLNPMTPDDVFRATAEGEVMPQKSTFFYPKVPTGMAFRDHRDEGDGGAVGAKPSP
ncbi:MAG TPA: DUF1015 domain-containing protein [Myxococcales bacterium]|nr:DUF1015 domain-containing protein [Myxococcales bacterium]HIK86629.1 DUF1015 domain-containing protein [Myxococcales bacterium]